MGVDLAWIIRLAVLLVAAGAGFWAGSWSGRDARAALERAEDAGKAAQAAHDTARSELERRLGTLTEQFLHESAQQRDAVQRRESQMGAVIAQRERRIAELDKAHAGKQAEIARLQAAAARAGTPEERVRIVKEIERVQGEDRVILVEADGRKCQAVPVPADLLAAWRGETP